MCVVNLEWIPIGRNPAATSGSSENQFFPNRIDGPKPGRPKFAKNENSLSPPPLDLDVAQAMCRFAKAFLELTTDTEHSFSAPTVLDDLI
eukprot:4404030-Karenia_brevis.AAC.1